MLRQHQIESYLNRLGITEIQPPTKEFLFALHKVHVETFPWQTVDVFARNPHPIDFENSVELMLEGKSGYCFHLNGAFAALLRSLGYRVTLHRAGVQSRGATPCIDSCHLGLVVDLTDHFSKKKQWIVDVGLGDMVYEPVPLRVGVYKQGSFTYQVVDSEVAQHGWRLVHDPEASFAGVDFDPEIVYDIGVFQRYHDHLSQSPDSPWVNRAVAKNRHAHGSNQLVGCVFTQDDQDGIRKTEILQQSQWFEILREVFRLRLTDYSETERDELWKRVFSAHEAWKASEAK